MSFNRSRTSIIQQANIGKQSIQGNAVTPTVRLQDFKFSLQPNMTHTLYTANGAIGAAGAVPNINNTTINFEATYPKYSELAWIFEGLINIGSGSYYAQSAVSKPTFYTMQFGDSTGCDTVMDCYVNSVTVSVDPKNGIKISGTIIGSEINRVPSLVACNPLDPSTGRLKWQSVYAEYDYTQYVTKRIEYSIRNRWKEYRDIDNVLHLSENTIDGSLRLRFEYNAIPVALFNDYKNGSCGLAAVHFQNQVSGNELILSMGGILTNLNEVSDEDGIYAVTLDFTAGHNANDVYYAADFY